MHRAVLRCSSRLGCASAGALFVFLACSTHIEQPAEEPAEPARSREGPSDGFNQEELGQLDELLDAGVSSPPTEPDAEAEASEAAPAK